MVGILEELRMRRRLTGFSKEIMRFEKYYDARYKDAKNKKIKPEEMEDLAQTYFSEKDLVEFEVFSERSKYLLSVAKARLVPYPAWSSDSADYVRSEINGSVFLTNKAQSELLAAIRKDFKENDDNIKSWSALMVGILGAAIGLVTVVSKAFGGS